MYEDFPYVSISEAAKAANESFVTIQKRINDGIIKAAKASAGIYIRKEELAKYLRVRGPKDELRFYTTDGLKRKFAEADKVDVSEKESGHEHN